MLYLSSTTLFIKCWCLQIITQQIQSQTALHTAIQDKSVSRYREKRVSIASHVCVYIARERWPHQFQQHTAKGVWRTSGTPPKQSLPASFTYNNIQLDSLLWKMYKQTIHGTLNSTKLNLSQVWGGRRTGGSVSEAWRSTILTKLCSYILCFFFFLNEQGC